MSYYDYRVLSIPVGYPPGEGDCIGVTGKISPSDVAALRAERRPPVLEIRDNGKDGDGVHLEVTVGVIRTEEPLCWIYLPDESLPTVVEALQSILRLRQAEDREPSAR